MEPKSPISSVGVVSGEEWTDGGVSDLDEQQMRFMLTAALARRSMFDVIHPNAAGIDIGATELWVCVDKDKATPHIRRFGTFTPDLIELVTWLKAGGVTTVAMESTGVYWIPVYRVLVQHGLQALVVNPSHIKHVPGRKSDIRDCQWIQELHKHGLVRGSFQPEEEFHKLRTYTRQRESLLDERASHINRMGKALTQMNVRLGSVLSDITGVSGLLIIRAIAAGERDAQQLLKHRQRGCKASPEEFIKALTANYIPEHVFALQQELHIFDFLTERIRECDERIEQHFASIQPKEPDAPRPPLGKRRKKDSHSKNQPGYDVRGEAYRVTGVDLTDIDGLQDATVQTLLSEVGQDMSRWENAGHFASWLGLAPRHEKSGGKILRSRTLPGNARANQAFRMAAQSAGKGNSAIGAFFRKKRAQLGAPKAIVATAHKLARIFYTLLKKRTPYIPTSAEAYDKQHEQRERKNLERRAKRLGLVLVNGGLMPA